MTAQQKPPAFTPDPRTGQCRQTACGRRQRRPRAWRPWCCSPAPAPAKPGPTDMVTVHYTGWTTDGKMFDSSFARNAPSSFPLNRVIKGWGEGVQLMVDGEKRRFWIPQELAYNGMAGGPPACSCSTSSCSTCSPIAEHTARRCRRAAGRCEEDLIGSGLQVPARGQGRHAPDQEQHRDGSLHRLDDRREDVRHLGRQGPADQLRPG